MSTMTKRCLGAFLSLALLLGLLPMRVEAAPVNPRATVNDTTIIGEVGGVPFGNTNTATINLQDAEFDQINPGDDLTDWFKIEGGKTIDDLGICAKVDTATNTQVKVHFEVSPTNQGASPSKRYGGEMEIIIPQSKLKAQGSDLEVEPNENAYYSIGPDFLALDPFSASGIYQTELQARDMQGTLMLRLNGNLNFLTRASTDEDLTSWFEQVPQGIKITLKEPIQTEKNTAEFLLSGMPEEVGVFYLQGRVPAVAVNDDGANYATHFPILTPLLESVEAKIEVQPKLTISGAGIRGMKGEALSANEVILTVEGDTFKAGAHDNWLQGFDGLGFTGQKIEILEGGKKARISLLGTPNQLKPETDLSVSVPASAFTKLSAFSSMENVIKRGLFIHITPYAPSLTGVELSPASVEIEKTDKSKANLKIAELKAIGSPQTGLAFELEGVEDDNEIFRIDGNQLKLVPGKVLEERTYTVKIKVLEASKQKNYVIGKKSFQVKFRTQPKQDPPSGGGQVPESSGSSSVVTPIDEGAKESETLEKQEKQDKKDNIKEEKKPESDQKQEADEEPNRDAGAEAKGESKDFAAHWAKREIEYVTERGLMNGVSADKFSPNASVSRGMLVTVLGRWAQVDPKQFEENEFSDVQASMYYAPYVAWAQKAGIVKGTGNQRFEPDALLTREQLAVILAGAVKAAGIELSETTEEIHFVDRAEISDWASESVRWMQKAGILNGKEGGRFDPKGRASRAELAKVIYLLSKK